ncbi:DNA methyltransferase [Plastoroseomonas arctica]|uniref:Methyltransferase n=1 Tax=Plastoroseomonas arctica TaxID=1509237 RepID=A0AAF1JXK0_9PROT|nr:DNA methyltransferase [Plastoroseomonas arctica]MBR0655787.1 site-specific DNA-methyltransferase [Plastoroseomonas arctica]
MEITTRSVAASHQYELNLSDGSAHYRTVSPPEADSTIFRHGRATLHLADPFAWLNACEPRSIQAVVTDPPFGVHEFKAFEMHKLRHGIGGVWRSPTHLNGHRRAAVPRFTVMTASDHQALQAFYEEFGRLVARIVVPGANIIVAAHPLLFHIVACTLVRSGLENRGSIMRQVTTLRGGDRPKGAEREFCDVSVMPRANWEPWLIFRAPPEGRVQDNLRHWGTGGFRRESAARPFNDLIQSSPASPFEKALAPHPCLKPQAFLRQIVKAVLPLGTGVVLDPFAGSGSMLAAANALGYASVGIEHDPVYFKLARAAIPELQNIECGKTTTPSKR